MIRNALILVMLAGTPAQADIQEGVNALGRGDYTRALEIFEPLAMTGDWNAQGFLAHTYRQMENNVEAYAWYYAMAKCGSLDGRIELGMFEAKLADKIIAKGKALGDIYHEKYCR